MRDLGTFVRIGEVRVLFISSMLNTSGVSPMLLVAGNNAAVWLDVRRH